MQNRMLSLKKKKKVLFKAKACLLKFPWYSLEEGDPRQILLSTHPRCTPGGAVSPDVYRK